MLYISRSQIHLHRNCNSNWKKISTMNKTSTIPTTKLTRTTSSFFKIINSPTEHLRVPPEFVRQNGKDLGANNIIFLKVPNVAVKWKVEYTVRELDGEVWFEKGWREFTKHYSISYGYFLIFDYKCHSDFNVLIFDLSATEIDYPPPPLEHASCKSTPAAKKRGPGKAIISNEATERANAFKSKNPFCIITMQRTYVDAKMSMICLPLRFCKSFLGRAQTEKKIVSSDNERCWSVMYRTKYFTSGWKNVVADNDLKVGDTCVFEVFPGNVLKLFLFRCP